MIHKPGPDLHERAANALEVGVLARMCACVSEPAAGRPTLHSAAAAAASRLPIGGYDENYDNNIMGGLPFRATMILC